MILITQCRIRDHAPPESLRSLVARYKRPPGFSVVRLAPFVTMLVTEVSQVASECHGKAFEMSRNHVQMGSIHGLDLEGAR